MHTCNHKHNKCWQPPLAANATGGVQRQFAAGPESLTRHVCQAAIKTLHDFAGVAVGLLALGESLPSSQSGRSLRLVSWLFIASGVAMLANGQGELGCALLHTCIFLLLHQRHLGLMKEAGG